MKSYVVTEAVLFICAVAMDFSTLITVAVNVLKKLYLHRRLVKTMPEEIIRRQEKGV